MPLQNRQHVIALCLLALSRVAEAHNSGALVFLLLGTLFLQLVGLSLQLILVKTNCRSGFWVVLERLILISSWLAWLTTAPTMFFASIFPSNVHGSEVLITALLAITQTLALYSLMKLTKADEPAPLEAARGPLWMTGVSLVCFALVVGIGINAH